MPATAAVRARGVQGLAASAAVIAAALGMAACSSRPPAALAQSPRSPSMSASATPSSPAATTLTGPQLDSALAPASSFPGFTANSKYAYQAGTGGQALPTQYNLATMSCQSFVTQLIYPTWFGQTGMAWAEYDRATGGQSSQLYDEFIYEFADAGTASTFIQALRSAFSRCQGFTNSEAGYSDTTTFAVTDVAPVDGGQAMQVTAAATATAGTVTVDFLFVTSGNDVYGVARGGGLTAVPASPAASAVIAGIITQVQSTSG